jgi:MFS family permease
LVPKDDNNTTGKNSNDEDNNDNNNDDHRGGIRNVVALGVVSFFTDFSTEMILGVLPLFVVSSLGLSKAALGSIEGSAELTSYAFRMISGTLSDNVGKRKSFIIIGYALSTISKPFFAATSGWLDTFLVRASDRIGKGIRTAPRDALIADSVGEKKIGKAFGIHGPIAAFGLLHLTNIRELFLFSLIPSAVAIIVIIFFVKEVIIKGKAGASTMLSNIQNVVKDNRPFVLLILITGIFSIGTFNFSFVLLRASDLGVNTSSIPLVYAVINITHTIIGIPSGTMADKIGKEKVLMIGYGIFAISAALMSLLYGNILYAFAIGAIYGIHMGISETMQRAVIPRYISADLKGSAYGLYNLVIGLSLFIGNVMFGLLWDKYNIYFATTYSIIIAIAAITGMLLFEWKYHKYTLSQRYSS